MPTYIKQILKDLKGELEIAYFKIAGSKLKVSSQEKIFNDGNG